VQITVLYSPVLYYTVLHCSVKYRSILCYTVLYSTLVYHKVHLAQYCKLDLLFSRCSLLPFLRVVQTITDSLPRFITRPVALLGALALSLLPSFFVTCRAEHN